MTSLQGLLPPPGSNNWRKSRLYTTDSDTEANVVRHIVIREVWVEKRPWPHAVYKIDVLSQTSHWFVFKRYKEFYQLHQKLVKQYGVPKNLLPPRKLTNNMARENLESRREALEHYLQKLLNSCNGSVRESEELTEFLDVKSHDVAHVTYNLATYLQKNGPSILMSKETFHMSPSQLYCVTKQLQLPHPQGKDSVDLGILYEFVAELRKLSITDFISQQSNGEQHEITFTFDLGMFASLSHLQMDAINIESLQGMEQLCGKLRKITARYCLTSMKSLLIDAALEKRSAPQVNISAERWRVHAAYRLADNRVVFQQWHHLTHINFSHNNITTFDTSMSLLPVLRKLDLSHNKINHLDLQLVTSPNLKTLLLSSNDIYLISATDKPIDNLKTLNLSHNKIQNVEGLICCQGLEDLTLSYNNVALIGEVKVLASLPRLKKLGVDGNHFAKKKRHRIVIFAYFRDRELLLDKKAATRKEKLKIEAKVSALENFQDMDDSLSSISTASDDSATDSGIDHSNWVSNLASLSEIEETSQEQFPKISWDELHGASDRSSTSSTTSSSDNNERNRSHLNPENFSRQDWDRLIHPKTKELLIPQHCRGIEESGTSDGTLRPEMSPCETFSNENHHNTNMLAHTRLDVRAKSKSKSNTKSNNQSKSKSSGKSLAFMTSSRKEEEPSKQGESSKSGETSKGESSKIGIHSRGGESSKMGESSKDGESSRTIELPAPKTTNWMSNLFNKQKPADGEKGEGTGIHPSFSDSSVNQAASLDETQEYTALDCDVSMSFDDNCDFERAEECSEVGEDSESSRGEEFVENVS